MHLRRRRVRARVDPDRARGARVRLPHRRARAARMMPPIRTVDAMAVSAAASDDCVELLMVFAEPELDLKVDLLGVRLQPIAARSLKLLLTNALEELEKRGGG